jgi:hypothetical protein
MDASEKNQLYFSQLVLMFHAAAMQQMGKTKSPLTDKIERDLSAAQGSIDLLDMLKEKTKGNLNADEERLLLNVLKELKLNYVDELNKPDEQTSKTEQSSTTQEGTKTG